MLTFEALSLDTIRKYLPYIRKNPYGCNDISAGSLFMWGRDVRFCLWRDTFAVREIIGEQPGGGDCVVASYVNACGHVGAISGSKQIGTMEGDKFISDETAVTVDIPLTREQGDEIYFHPEKIAQALP